jgi:hypothetical protein
MSFWRMIVLALGLCVTTVATAETVTGAKVNCRAAARANAILLGTLDRGDTVPVLSRQNGWSYVDPSDLPACFVKSEFLSSASAIVGTSSSLRAARRPAWSGPSYRRGTTLFSMPRIASHRKARSTSTPRRARSRGSYSGGGSCPCSGSQVCIGPRGGRYCITSGGNKRYGV